VAIIWDDSLKTGISIIDEQHEQLFETINKFEKFKESNTGLKEILIELQTYMTRHFITEEEYMRYTEYPDYINHKKAHDKFLDDYRELIKKNLTNDCILNSGLALTKFAEDWLTEHYTNTDIKMAKHIRSCQQHGD
jgi:hemerythrin